jgi:protein-histidine pros-kinase
MPDTGHRGLNHAQPVDATRLGHGVQPSTAKRRGAQARAARDARNLAYRSAHDQLAANLFDAMPDAIVAADGDGMIVLLNAQAERLFGYTGPELAGHSLELLVPSSARHIHAVHRSATLDTAYLDDPRPRPMGAGAELVAQRRDGSRFPAELSLAALRSASGVIVAATIRDLSSRRLVEQQLHARVAELERSGRAKDIFLAGVTEELRHPLETMVAHAAAARTGDGPALGVHHLQAIERQGDRLLAVLDDLQDLTRIETRSHAAVLEPVDCVEVIRAAVAALQPLADAKSLLLSTRLTAKTAPVRSDSRALGQILVHLIGNGIRFTDDGWVSVALRPATPHRGTTITVSDSGPGIAEEDVARLFAPDAAARSAASGGLGLQISRRLAGLVGARLSVDSKLGVGSTFSVELPDRLG